MTYFSLLNEAPSHHRFCKSLWTIEAYRETRRVTLIGGHFDLVLGIVKIIVGFVSHSLALIADGGYSFSDVATDLLVIAAARNGAQAPVPFLSRRAVATIGLVC
jgi:Co/Zn/Cd efflux system component